jgi:alkylation response protein AidB-like acyl-CoA dehydrogenase
MQNSSHELKEIRNIARKLLQKELAPKVEQTEETGVFCREALLKLGEAGLAAPMLPDPWGQGELTASGSSMSGLMMQVTVAEEMGYVSSGFGLSVLASVCLFGANVGRQGTRAQCENYLPGIASGQKIGC